VSGTILVYFSMRYKLMSRLPFTLTPEFLSFLRHYDRYFGKDNQGNGDILSTFDCDCRRFFSEFSCVYSNAICLT